MANIAYPSRPASYDKAVGLVLQGGGALGSYQAGVFEAIAGSAYRPDWIAGISIGAINAALIAGNPPDRQVAALRDFWETITAPAAFWPGNWATFGGGQAGSLNALMFGQPGFFSPRSPGGWLFGSSPTSFYDTSALKTTLERLVDFDRINRGETRLSVGAVNVRTGDMVWFDSATMALRAEHIMASGALPPGFAPVEIDGALYWDGGLVSNTPLQYVLDYVPRRSRLTFQVDLFAPEGRAPTNLEEVNERDKDIRYSSRTRSATEAQRRTHDLRHTINGLLEQLPDALRSTPEARSLYEFGCVTTMDIVDLTYRPTETQGPSTGFEFSRETMRARWAHGLADARATLAAAPWLAPMPREIGARTFDMPARS